MRIYSFLFFILLTGCARFSGQAQIVNIENARIQADTVGWMGNLGVSAAVAQNVDKILQGNAEVHLQGKTKSKNGVWIVMGNAGFLKINKNRVVSDNLFHLRFNHNVNKWLVWEVFGQYQTNYITQIAARTLLGTGPRFILARSNLFHLFSACLFMYEREKERTTPAVHHNDIRNSSYI